ncbi:hypothetical protein SUDANB58_00249 [Streptomyces sp. enrichment culture]
MTLPRDAAPAGAFDTAPAPAARPGRAGFARAFPAHRPPERPDSAR